MFVSARADALDADGRPLAPSPAVLYGYGGFGISLTPGYSAGLLAWVEAGGVYAIANLRGGGEEGEEWHRAGMLGHKQNVFDDFHAAAERLIADGWTTRDRLAVSGGSNGGLLVGAALTQRPELYAAVVCSAPLLDMVRYQLHGLGVSWTGEYGDADRRRAARLAAGATRRTTASPRAPSTRRRCSPCSTATPGSTRCTPASCAPRCSTPPRPTRRQRPVLLRREADVGHGARALSRSVELSADTLAFMARHTRLEVGSVRLRLLASTPSPSPSGSVLPDDVLDTAVNACDEGARICRLVTDATGSAGSASGPSCSWARPCGSC